MQQYLKALQHILDYGNDRKDRTGIGTRSVFAMQMRYNMQDGFPAVTTKKLAFKMVIAELLWMISGSTKIQDLQKLGCHIWDANAAADYWQPKAKFAGDLGRVYGAQWRDWQNSQGRSIDQLQQVIDRIKNKPNDRRLLVCAWNPGELDQMAIPPCHALFQFFVADGKLSLQMYQRSGDMVLGVPFNIASYSLLLQMVAQITNLQAHEFIHTLGDAHIYHNHFNQVKQQLQRKPYSLAKLKMKHHTNIDQFKLDDFKLIDYKYYAKIKATMAV